MTAWGVCTWCEKGPEIGELVIVLRSDWIHGFCVKGLAMKLDQQTRALSIVTTE